MFISHIEPNSKTISEAESPQFKALEGCADDDRKVIFQKRLSGGLGDTRRICGH